MANRRLGVEYIVNGYETTGTSDLPDPDTEVPGVAESVNGIQEYRPDYRGDATASSVKPFLDRTVEDCVEAWQNGSWQGESDTDVDRDLVSMMVA
jgi:hypothetical protein